MPILAPLSRTAPTIRPLSRYLTRLQGAQVRRARVSRSPRRFNSRASSWRHRQGPGPQSQAWPGQQAAADAHAPTAHGVPRQAPPCPTRTRSFLITSRPYGRPTRAKAWDAPSSGPAPGSLAAVLPNPPSDPRARLVAAPPVLPGGRGSRLPPSNRLVENCGQDAGKSLAYERARKGWLQIATTLC